MNKLDTSKLLGFRIAGASGAKAGLKPVALSAKVGGKVGLKTV